MSVISSFTSRIVETVNQQLAGLQARNDVFGALSSLVITRTTGVLALAAIAYLSGKNGVAFQRPCKWATPVTTTLSSSSSSSSTGSTVVAQFK